LEIFWRQTWRQKTMPDIASGSPTQRVLSYTTNKVFFRMMFDYFMFSPGFYGLSCFMFCPLNPNIDKLPRAFNTLEMHICPQLKAQKPKLGNWLQVQSWAEGTSTKAGDLCSGNNLPNFGIWALISFGSQAGIMLVFLSPSGI